MTHAELLRKHATDATNEGGIWFSGEYLSRIAETAESLEADNARLREQVDAAHMSRLLTENENAKLRELAKKLVILAFARCADCDLFDVSCALVPTQKCLLWNECESIARKLGVDVDDG